MYPFAKQYNTDWNQVRHDNQDLHDCDAFIDTILWYLISSCSTVCPFFSEDKINTGNFLASCLVMTVSFFGGEPTGDSFAGLTTRNGIPQSAVDLACELLVNGPQWQSTKLQQVDNKPTDQEHITDNEMAQQLSFQHFNDSHPYHVVLTSPVQS